MNHTLFKSSVRFRNYDITVETENYGNNQWALNIIVESISVVSVFRFNGSNLSYEEWLKFSRGKLNIKTKFNYDSVDINCTIREGFYIFTVDNPDWKMSVGLPVDLVGRIIRDAVTHTKNQGYVFAPLKPF